MSSHLQQYAHPNSAEAQSFAPEAQLLLAIIRLAWLDAEDPDAKRNQRLQAQTWLTAGFEPEAARPQANPDPIIQRLPHSFKELCDLANLDAGWVYAWMIQQNLMEGVAEG